MIPVWDMLFLWQKERARERSEVHGNLYSFCSELVPGHICSLGHQVRWPSLTQWGSIAACPAALLPVAQPWVGVCNPLTERGEKLGPKIWSITSSTISWWEKVTKQQSQLSTTYLVYHYQTLSPLKFLPTFSSLLTHIQLSGQRPSLRTGVAGSMPRSITHTVLVHVYCLVDSTGACLLYKNGKLDRLVIYEVWGKKQHTASDRWEVTSSWCQRKI